MKVGDIINLHPERLYVYGLYDERDEIIRYVGRTGAPLARLQAHFGTGSNPVRYRKPLHNWIRSVRDSGNKIAMKILAIAESGQGKYEEKKHIDRSHKVYICRMPRKKK